MFISGFERFVPKRTILVFERRSERSVHPKRTAKIVQNGRSEREAG